MEALIAFSIVGLDNQVVVEATGDRKLENGLVIPGIFKAITRSR